MRAYLRLDPHLADKKATYPDGAFRAFVECLCFAEQQPERGRFRNERLLRVLLERRARWVTYLVAHGDLILEPDGRLYLDGWKEWQEGDVTVPERMKRLRNRKGKGDTPATVTDDTPATVTVPSSGKRLAVGGKQEAEAGGRNNGQPNGTFMTFPPKPPKPRTLTTAEIAAFRRHAADSRDPLIRKNARETLERAGIPIESEWAYMDEQSEVPTA